MERRRRVAAPRITILAASALLALCLPAAASAQWSAPDAQGNISTTNTGNVGVGTNAPVFRLDVTGSTNSPFRVRDNAGREYFSTTTRTGPWGTGPVASVGGGRLIVDSDGPDGDNNTVIRRMVNSLIFNPSDHSQLPGAFMVRQQGGVPILFVEQRTSGNVGVGTTAPAFLLDVSGSAGSPFRVRDGAGREYFSTSTRTGPWGTGPVASVGGGRLIVDSDGPDGDNNTIIRRMVNSLIFNPSDHSQLPGAFAVRQQGGTPILVVEQKTNGNIGVGTWSPAAKLHVAGDIRVDGNISAKYQDVAEWVPSTQKLAAGMVVVLDPERSNHVLASTASYDTAVAGVISEKPGLALGEAAEGRALVATTGRVKVRVDATHSPIRIGDLLVTSDRPGVAMKSEPIAVGGRRIHAPGTIIGKALEPLTGGTGEILVLLSLQ